MKIPHQSKLISILMSTLCLVAFGLLASPIFTPGARVANGIRVSEAPVSEATNSEVPAANLRVPAGKSLIVESSVRIVRSSVADPQLVRAVSIDEHELLLNGKTPGRTKVTVWQEDGRERRFDVLIGGQPALADGPLAEIQTKNPPKGLAGAYQNAMTRVQTAITGVDQ